jgi:DNA-binding MarR family transcriptional regulator
MQRSSHRAAQTRGQHTPKGAQFTELILEVFRLNGLLVAAGNELSAPAGLTSARWQVLGGIALASEPLTVAQIARSMGLTRQGVQRLVDELEAAGLVRRTADPESLKTRPVTLSEAGKTAYERVMSKQQPWANQIASETAANKLAQTVEVLRELRLRLEGSLPLRRRHMAHGATR